VNHKDLGMMYSATASRIFHPQAIVMNWLHIALGLAALSASQPAVQPSGAAGSASIGHSVMVKERWLRRTPPSTAITSANCAEAVQLRGLRVLGRLSAARVGRDFFTTKAQSTP
jgi:hypothetical protein